jgi:hypothetical protein
MSPFAKLVSLSVGIIAILYLFTCSTFVNFKPTKKSINHDKMVQYVLKEVEYEIAYGDNMADVEDLIDKAILKALKEK